MLFFLTGDIQTGKTRWLANVLERLHADGVPACGVLAPGIWMAHAGTDENGMPTVAYEKLGFDNLLLPYGELVPFARRRDLAEQAGSYDANSQSGQMQLGWAIDDAAIVRVNRHFDELATYNDTRALLVIDELGQLEILKGTGLTSAISLLDRGATTAFPHALVVMRSWLLEQAQIRFANAPWNGIRIIRPDNDGENDLRAAFESKSA